MTLLEKLETEKVFENVNVVHRRIRFSDILLEAGDDDDTISEQEPVEEDEPEEETSDDEGSESTDDDDDTISEQEPVEDGEVESDEDSSTDDDDDTISEQEPVEDGEDDSDEETSDDSGSDDSTDDESEDNKEDKYNIELTYRLMNKFTLLYDSIDDIGEKIKNMRKDDIVFNRCISTVSINFDKLKKVMFDYISKRFNKTEYNENLINYNLFLESFKVNLSILEKGVTNRAQEKQ